MRTLQGLKSAAGALFLMLSSATQAQSLTVIVENQKGQLLENAVVFVESEALINSASPMPSAEVAQKDKSFIPQVRVVTRGTPVEFPNRDTVRHHVYSFSEAKTFELKLYIGKPRDPVVFDQSGVVELGCNIHDQMLGWVIVTDTPVFAGTDAQGRVEFNDLSADDYVVRAWHPDLPYGADMMEQTLKLSGSDAELKLILETL